MKFKIYFFVIVCISFLGLCFAKVIRVPSNIDEQRCAIINKNTPTQWLLELCTLTNIEHNNTLESIVQATQRSQSDGGWIRPANLERWQAQEIFEQSRDAIIAWFKNIGAFETMLAHENTAKYCLLLGATIPSVRERIACMVKAWESGVTFEQLIIVGGHRPLDPERESLQQLLNPDCTPVPFKKNWQLNSVLPQTELEMMAVVLDQLELPLALQNVPKVFINCPMQKNHDGSFRRPNRQDTILYWLQEFNPQPGLIVAISSQPMHPLYEDAVLRSWLPEVFAIQTIAGAVKNLTAVRISILLDALARFLYVEHQRSLKN